MAPSTGTHPGLKYTEDDEEAGGPEDAEGSADASPGRPSPSSDANHQPAWAVPPGVCTTSKDRILGSLETAPALSCASGGGGGGGEIGDEDALCL